MCFPGSNSLAPRKGEEGDQVGKGYVFGGVVFFYLMQTGVCQLWGRGDHCLRAGKMNLQVTPGLYDPIGMGTIC